MSKVLKADLGKVMWLERGWQPVHIGFCPSRKAWNREMRRMAVTGDGAKYPGNDGCMTTFDSKGRVCVIITLAEKAEQRQSRTEIAGLLCHEAAHVWQCVRETMQEREPSAEFEAYSMQAIFQGLYQAWLDTRCPDEMKAACAVRRAA